jgi:hypothetical protein
LDYSSALSKDHRSVETCWGTAIGGFTDTTVLTEKVAHPLKIVPAIDYIKIRELLKEFLSSGDKDEASKCLRELDVPHFHHELVFEAIMIAMESEDENVINQMTWLLQYMFKEVRFKRELTARFISSEHTLKILLREFYLLIRCTVVLADSTQT